MGRWGEEKKVQDKDKGKDKKEKKRKRRKGMEWKENRGKGEVNRGKQGTVTVKNVKS